MRILAKTDEKFPKGINFGIRGEFRIKICEISKTDFNNKNDMTGRLEKT